MTPRTAGTRRAAFTLVELLIVVTIIALLAGLLLVGIQKIGGAGKTVVATQDITSLQAATETFKREFGFYPPSEFRLPSMPDPNLNTSLTPQQKALEVASFALLKQMYPRWAPQLTGTGMINWTGAYPSMAGYIGQNLDGNQSMVLFLGGPLQTGWATDSPQATAGTAVKGPYFEFKQDRLDGNQGGPRHFLDPFKNPTNPNGKPYAYLASQSPGGKYPAVGCLGVFAVCETANKFVNQSGVQIVSAGEDGVFGSFGSHAQVYSAGAGPFAEGTAGFDDLANFNNGNKLGVGR
jgi:prepilin-type N-terminal cleavage/methylation domain-containing protein